MHLVKRKRRLFITNVESEPRKKAMSIMALALGEDIQDPEYNYDILSKYSIEHINTIIRRAILQYNKALNECERHEQIAFEDITNDEVRPHYDEYPLCHTITFILNLVSSKLKCVSSIKCVIYHVYKPSSQNRYFDSIEENCAKRAQLYKKSVQFIGIGQLDSNLDHAEQGDIPVQERGYNKFLRTCAYNIMHSAFKCKFIVSDAHVTTSAHVLMKYFKGFANAREILKMYKSELKKARSEHVKQNLINHINHIINMDKEETNKNMRLIRSINAITKASANIVIDLTDKVKLDALKFMENSVYLCLCPPCKNSI